MHRLSVWIAMGLALVWISAVTTPGRDAQEPRSAARQQFDLAERLAAGQLRVVNRDVTVLPKEGGVHLSQREGNGIA